MAAQAGHVARLGWAVLAGLLLAGCQIVSSGARPTAPNRLAYVGLDGGPRGFVTREFRFHGDRSMIKQRSSQAALDLLRRWLAGGGGA